MRVARRILVVAYEARQSLWRASSANQFAGGKGQFELSKFSDWEGAIQADQFPT